MNNADFLELLKSYKRLIQRDAGQYPAVVLDDIEKSITYVLSKEKSNDAKL